MAGLFVLFPTVAVSIVFFGDVLMRSVLTYFFRVPAFSSVGAFSLGSIFVEVAVFRKLGYEYL